MYIIFGCYYNESDYIIMSEEKAENNQDELKGGTRRSRKD